MDNTLSKLGQIRVFSKVLSKVSQIRNRGAKQKVLNALERNEYFQRFIHDPTERQQFLSSASPYIKYRFYPKGTAIVELKKPISSLSVIVKGKALLYTQRDVDEMRKEGAKTQKSQVIQIYVRYMAREQLEEKFKKWLSSHEHGTKALRKRMASLSLTDEGIERESAIPDEDDFCSIVEQVLQEENPLLPPHLRENDLTFEEKLLLLSTLGTPGDHLRNGNLALKGDKELKAGDNFGEAGLIKPIHANFVVIATEDTHIVSFTRTDYKLLFASDIPNIKEKIDFLQKTFVEIPKQIIMEMAYYLEEKVMFTSEMAYKEGEEADAIYMIKHGEIEISATKEQNTVNDYLFNERLQSKAKTKFNEKQKIMVGRLPAGSIFGEEEIIKKMKKRKYSAKALQPLTFLYVIKKKIFHEIFENYFPDTVHILKDWMELKYKWREQRIKKEQKISEMRNEENEAATEKSDMQKSKRMTKEDSALKARRTVTEKDADSVILGGDNTSILMNTTLRFNNFSPSSSSVTGTGPNMFFTKFKNSTKVITPREAQSKIIFKVPEPKDIIQSKEEIEKQKTKLFVDNQVKFNKFRRPHLSSSKKMSTAKRNLEISTKVDLPTTQILNFERAKDLQKAEKLATQEGTQPSSSRKASTNSLSSPRFFIVRSYGLSNNVSPSALESEQFWRRHSSHMFRDYESTGPLSMKNLEVRRGTVAGDIKESKFEDEKYEHMKNYMEGLISNKKKNTNFMIRPATSLQQLERGNKTKTQTPSNGGSLAYLDTKLDEPSLNEPQSAKNASLLLKDANFGKKVLSPKTADQVKIPTKGGFANFPLKVNGKTFDKHIE